MEQNVDKEVIEYKKLEKQLEIIVTQRVQMEMQAKEVELAINELNKIKTNEVYKMIGGIMIKSNKEDALKDLNEKQELLNTRIKSLKDQEEKLRLSLSRIIKKLQGNI